MTNKQEQGRSMVEMLGVLAVVGVLSAGGIAGYTYAMDRHRTNELLNEASKRAVVVASQIASGRTPSLAEFGTGETAGGTISTEPATDIEGGVGIKVSGVKESVCKNLVKLENDVMYVAKDDKTLSEVTEADCSGDSNAFMIVFENMGGGSKKEDSCAENPCECGSCFDPSCPGYDPCECEGESSIACECKNDPCIDSTCTGFDLCTCRGECGGPTCDEDPCQDPECPGYTECICSQNSCYDESCPGYHPCACGHLEACCALNHCNDVSCEGYNRCECEGICEEEIDPCEVSPCSTPSCPGFVACWCEQDSCFDPSCDGYDENCL